MTDADDPRRQGKRNRKRRRDAFDADQRKAAFSRKMRRQRERRRIRKETEAEYQSNKRAAERRRYHQRKGRRRRLKNTETVERQYIKGGLYVASLTELQHPTFVIIDSQGRKRWETLAPDIA